MPLTQDPFLVFVTPAYRRYELSRICFAQRRNAIDRLREEGIYATCVVIADDENLDIAREFDFEVVESDNEWVGRKFNDGYEHASKLGATHVAPVGSDSWVDPDFLIGTLYDDVVTSSRHYARINQFGLLRKQLWVPVLQGVTYAVPIGMLEKVAHRPCADRINRGCDGSTWQNLERANNGILMHWSESHSLETIGFVTDTNISPYESSGQRYQVSETANPFDDLIVAYPPPLVDRVQNFYEKNRDENLLIAYIERGQRMDVEGIVNRVVDANQVPSASRQLVKKVAREAAMMALASRVGKE
jgi:hypothetical protein